jgi:hypothetical protein
VTVRALGEKAWRHARWRAGVTVDALLERRHGVETARHDTREEAGIDEAAGRC